MSNNSGYNFSFSGKLVPPAWVEPSPNWVSTLQALKWLWYAHVYGFGVSFLVLALCSVVSITALFRSGRSRNKTHFIVISLLLFHLGALRGVVLFWNPYLSSGNDSKSGVLACVVSWGIAKACLTAAFSIMLLIFLETTRIALAPPRFQNLPFLVAVAFVNIGYLTLSDTVVIFYPAAKVLILICQVTFAVWGLLVCLGYLLACKRMQDNLISSKNFRNQFFAAETKRLSRLRSLILAASAFGAGNFALSIYISASKQGVLSEMGEVDSWSWYGTQTSLRLLELLMSLFLILVGHNNKRSNQRSTQSHEIQPHMSQPTVCRSTKVGASDLTIEDIHQG